MRKYPLSIFAILCFLFSLWLVLPALFEQEAEELAPSLSAVQQRQVSAAMHRMLADIRMPPPAAPVVSYIEPAKRTWKAPRWVVKGILKKETRSKLTNTDEVVYVDKRRGRAGERGPTQLKRIAFEQVAKPGEQFSRLEHDASFALDITERYLLWLRSQTHNWNDAIAAYNVGLVNVHSGAGRDYLADIKHYANS